MARFNEILAGRLNRALQKFTGIKAAAPTPQLATEFLPVFPFFWGAENRYLEQWQRYGFNAFLGAATGFISVVQLRNPTGSKVVAIMEKVQFFNTNAASASFTIGIGPRQLDYGTLFPASGAVARFDFRGQQSTSLIGSDANNVAAVGLPTTPFGVFPLAPTNGVIDVIITDIQELTVLPGDSIQFYTAGTNLNLELNVWWRERPLEESEVF